MQTTFTVNSTKRFEIIDITKQVKDIVAKSKVKNGLCNIYTQHATSAIIINENYDPQVCGDVLDCLAKLVPVGVWKHDKEDGNTDAHIKASIIGPQQTIPLMNNKLMLGQWQAVMFADFDGPRRGRKIIVTIINDK